MSTQPTMTEGERLLEQAATLLAKASRDAGEALDDDFADLDAAAERADAEAERAEAEAEVADAEAELAGVDEEEDDDDDEDFDLEPEGEEFVKAEGTLIDATPILQAVDAKLAKLTRLAKAVSALQGDVATLLKERRASFAIAKAQQAALESLTQGFDAPRRPKSQQRVAVPSAGATHDPKVIYAKAEAVITDAAQMGVVEHYYHRRDVSGMLGALTPAQRAKVLAND